MLNGVTMLLLVFAICLQVYNSVFAEKAIGWQCCQDKYKSEYISLGQTIKF